MVSFLRVLEQMKLDELRGPIGDDDPQEGPLLDSGDETQAMAAVRTGLQLRKPDCGEFWDDFITLTGNADALSELLEVPKDKITGWSSKINDLIEKVKKADDQEAGGSDRAEVVPTDNEPAADSGAGDMPPQDSRPLPS